MERTTDLVPCCPYCFHAVWTNIQSQICNYCINCGDLDKIFWMQIETDTVEIVEPIPTDEELEKFKSR